MHIYPHGWSIYEDANILVCSIHNRIPAVLHAHMHARACARTQNACAQAHTRAHTHRRTRMHARSCACKRARAHARTHARKQAHVHAHTSVRMRACMRACSCSISSRAPVYGRVGIQAWHDVSCEHSFHQDPVGGSKGLFTRRLPAGISFIHCCAYMGPYIA